MQHSTGSTLTERVITITPQRMFGLLGVAGVLCIAALTALDGTVQRAVATTGVSLFCVACAFWVSHFAAPEHQSGHTFYYQ